MALRPAHRLSPRIAMIALAANVALAASARAATWIPTALPWTDSASNKKLPPLPQTVAIAPTAYAYAAESAPIDVFGKASAVILRLDLQVNSGSVGIFRAAGDGKSALSKEEVFKSKGDVTLYFRVVPTSPPARLTVRNYDAVGQSGQVVIKSVEFIREADLTNDELTEIVKQGLH
jgi:hypothetical protein